MSYSSVKKYMGFKLGSLPVVTADVDIRFRGDPVLTPNNEHDDDTRTVRPDAGIDKSIKGIKTAELPYEFYLCQGSSQVPPNYGKLLKNAGSVETIHGTTGVEYEFSSSGWDNLGSAVWGELSNASTPVGIAQSIEVASSTISIAAANVGAKVVASGSIMGRYAGVADVPNVSLPSTDFSALNPVSFINSPVTIDSISVCAQSFNIDMANSVEYHTCSGETSGVFDARITSNDPRMTLTVAKSALTTFDPSTYFCYDGVPVTISIAGNLFTAPNAQLIDYKNTSVNSVACWELTFKLLPNDGLNVNLDDSTFLSILQGTRS